MNRLILIGNGFDLAHGLKTSYADFINWYWGQRMLSFNDAHGYVSEDELCRFTILHRNNEEKETWSTLAYSHNCFNSALGKNYVGKDIIASIIEDKENFETKFSPFFERITHSIETKGWVDIENEYYELLKEYSFPNDPNITKEDISAKVAELNNQLSYLTKLLVQYLSEVEKSEKESCPSIRNAIYAPFSEEDIAIDSLDKLQEHKSYWENHAERDNELSEIAIRYGYEERRCMGQVRGWRENEPHDPTSYPYAFLLPKNIMLVNFNYTNTTRMYLNRHFCEGFEDVHIHGSLKNKSDIIFGYGDELDCDYQKLKESNISGCLQNVKSIRYMEATNYRLLKLAPEPLAPYSILLAYPQSLKRPATSLTITVSELL